MDILTIVGARPQFIKAASVSRVLRAEHAGTISETIIHTGQHYDENMSERFFRELDIPEPLYNLAIAGGTHASMTGRMLEAIEKVLLEKKPDWVLVYGDTNSTLAAALASVKLHIPVAHVEAGLRSFNTRMPEEINRMVTDRVSTLLFCPTQTAVQNLSHEGMTKGVYHVGDVMYDAALFYAEKARTQSRVLETLRLHRGEFALATCHRAENTNDPQRLRNILSALGAISDEIPVVFPIHPRTEKIICDLQLESLLKGVQLIPPVSFLDMVALEQSAALILTDSGGVQKEAFFYGVPCMTMRDETEWVETIACGNNHLCGADAKTILRIFQEIRARSLKNNRTSLSVNGSVESPYGDGRASNAIIQHILKQ